MKTLMGILLSAFALHVNAFSSSFSGDGHLLAENAQSFQKKRQDFSHGVYIGQVGGVASAYSSNLNPHAVCYPDGVSADQLAKITDEWLRENPNQLDMDAVVLIWWSHEEAYGLKSSQNCHDHDIWKAIQKNIQERIPQH